VAAERPAQTIGKALPFPVNALRYANQIT